MVGRSHLLVGLTAGVILDSFTHLSGPPLTVAAPVTRELLLNKGIFYFMVGLGALLPDIDNARSTLGRKLGVISKEIQHLAGHRTIFHSILGLILGSLLALGLGQIITHLLLARGIDIPDKWAHLPLLVFFAVLFGCIMHIAADALTEGGVPLFWPFPGRYGFPPDRHMRFRTDAWQEHVIVFGFMLLVGIGIWQSIIVI